jgi:hypothetical protein
MAGLTPLPTGASYMIESPVLGAGYVIGTETPDMAVNQLPPSSSMAAFPPSWNPCIIAFSCGND